MIFGVNEKTIQRDIKNIRVYLSNRTETKCRQILNIDGIRREMILKKRRVLFS